jgi:opacity protein-like surface antigen
MRANAFGYLLGGLFGFLCWPTVSAAQMPEPTPGYDWTGPYLGGHLGAAWGSSSWSGGPGIGGSSSLFQPVNSFDEGGSWLAGLQGGYNYVLPNHLLLGAEADFTFPPFPKLPTGPNPFGLTIGQKSTFNSPALGAVDFSETVLASGSVRARVGYAPGNWLIYGTGGFAWTYDRQSLTQSSTGTPSRRPCGGLAGPPAPASRRQLHRIGPRGSNTSTRTTARARAGSLATRNRSRPTSSSRNCGPD